MYLAIYIHIYICVYIYIYITESLCCTAEIDIVNQLCCCCLVAKSCPSLSATAWMAAH